MANQIFEDLKFKIKNGNPVTRLIIINCAVFLLISILRIITFLGGNNGMIAAFTNLFISNLTLPLSLNGFIYKPWTLITYMFTHVDLMHIFWNAITLFWFGTILGEFISTKKIIPLYILGGIAGAIISLLLINFIPAFYPYTFSSMLGASAGVTAIIIASATLIPNYSINLMFIGPVKLLYVALFVLFIDVLNVASYSNVGGNLAHLGGALMGYFFIIQFKKGNDFAKPINSIFEWFNKLFHSGTKTRMKVAYKRKVTNEEFNTNKIVTQQQIDTILDKISKSGYDSLSKNEKDILFKASSKK